MSKRVLSIAFMIGGIAALASFLISWHLPRIESTVRLYVEKELSKQLPFTILPDEASFSLFPISMKLNKVTFLPKKEAQFNFDPFKVEKLAVSLSFFDLIIGKIWLNSLEVNGLELNLFFETKNKKKKKQEIEIFKILQTIPITELNIKNTSISLNLPDEGYLTQFENIDLSAYNEGNSIYLNLDTESIRVFDTIKETQIEVGLHFKTNITEKNFVLSELQIKKGEAFAIASGSGEYLEKNLGRTTFNGKIRAEASFKDANEVLFFLKKSDDLKILHGDNRIDAHLKLDSQQYIVEFNGVTRNLGIDDKLLENLSYNGVVANNFVRLESVQLDHSGGQIELTDVKYGMNSDNLSSLKINLKGINLKTFLDNSKITQANVYLNLSGTLNCKGKLKELQISCPGKLVGKNLKVLTKSGSKAIVTAQSPFELNGTVNANLEQIDYHSDIKLGKATGKSKGKISYENGFDIDYQTSNFDFNEIKQIANLDFTGKAKLTGSTQGNSDTAVFSIKIDSEAVTFQKYALGSVKTNLQYKSGKLYFNNLSSTLGSSRYRGRLVVDLVDDKLDLTASFPYLRLQDVQEAISEKVPISTKLIGSGSAKLKLWGPFEIKKINFDLKSHFYRGNILGQSYDELDLPIKARGGYMRINNSKAKLKNSLVYFEGKISPEFNTNIDFKTSNLFIRELNLVTDNKIPVNGFLYARGTIVGPIEEPKVSLNGTINGFNFNKKIISSVKFNYSHDADHLKIIANAKDQFNLTLKYPKTDKGSFLSKGFVSQFDISPLISFILGTSPKDNYSIKTSSVFQVESPSKNLWNASGKIKISNIDIKQSGEHFKLKKPASITISRGIKSIDEIHLIGSATENLVIKDNGSVPGAVNLGISGKLDLSYFSIFAPFIESIEGTSALKMSLKSTPNKTSFIGSALVDRGVIKLESFDYPFYEVQSDIIFSQNDILLNSIKGRFADGSFYGTGGVKIVGRRNYPIDFKVNMDQIKLNLPDGFSTVGDASLKLNGSWFPFVIKGNYNVTGGLINFEPSSVVTKQKRIKDNLLPEFLKKEDESPLALDIKVKTEKAIEVKNSFVQGYATANMNINGPIGTPRVTGRTSLTRRSRIIFKDTEFTVTDSNIKFSGRTPINPDLLMRAETRIEKYDIKLLVQGKAGKPLIRFTSSPSLPEGEIVSLLALGSTSRTIGDDINTATTNQQPTTTSQSVEVGTSLLSDNPLGREFKQRTGFDIDFSSTLDDAVLSGPTITVKRRISDGLQLTASHRTGKQSESDIKLRREFNDDFSGILSIKNRNYEEVENTSQFQKGTEWGFDLQYNREFK